MCVFIYMSYPKYIWHLLSNMLMSTLPSFLLWDELFVISKVWYLAGHLEIEIKNKLVMKTIAVTGWELSYCMLFLYHFNYVLWFENDLLSLMLSPPLLLCSCVIVNCLTYIVMHLFPFSYVGRKWFYKIFCLVP